MSLYFMPDITGNWDNYPDKSMDNVHKVPATTLPLPVERPSVPFNNQSGLEFTDISSEEYRVYSFYKETAIHVRIENPLKLAVSSSGGHRIFDANGVSHYIPAGWLKLSWKAKPGHPHFVE